MIKKKKKSGDGGANWMDTYGDMVTLLLCFFVLLYSMSTIDTEKWLAIVQSFNPDAVQTPTATSGESGPNAEVSPDPVKASIQELYQQLEEYVEQQQQQDNISVTEGDGYVFISMDNTVFFDGDSYVLRQDGQLLLDDLSVILTNVSSSIDEIRILGHTAQEDPNKPNNDLSDRILASNRATVVTVYLQKKHFIDPARLVSIGYGQHRPIAQNDDRDGRKQNRRVEFIISSKTPGELDSLQEYYQLGDRVAPEQVATAPAATPEGGTTPP